MKEIEFCFFGGVQRIEGNIIVLVWVCAENGRYRFFSVICCTENGRK
jgi:hypothetical protein